MGKEKLNQKEIYELLVDEAYEKGGLIRFKMNYPDDDELCTNQIGIVIRVEDDGVFLLRFLTLKDNIVTSKLALSYSDMLEVEYPYYMTLPQSVVDYIDNLETSFMTGNKMQDISSTISSYNLMKDIFSEDSDKAYQDFKKDYGDYVAEVIENTTNEEVVEIDYKNNTYYQINWDNIKNLDEVKGLLNDDLQIKIMVDSDMYSQLKTQSKDFFKVVENE